MGETSKGTFDISPKRRALLEALLQKEGIGVANGDKVPRRLSTGQTAWQTYPLSFAQERVWFMDRLLPGNPLYNLSCDWRFIYPVDLDVVRRSVNEIVRRHEALRTTFGSVDGEPVQIIAATLELELPVLDLRHLPESERESRALSFATDEARRPFDLAQGPLLRISLLRMGEDEYIFLLTIHHIISDGWSLDLFWNELLAIWTAFENGEECPLPDLPIQYVEFALWQRKWLSGKVLDTQLSYWKKQLQNLQTLDLPTDRPRPSVQTGNGQSYEVAFKPYISTAVKTMSEEHRVTLFMTLLGAFQVLLFRYSGQDDVATGTFIANRNRAEIEPLIGFFVNTLVLRADFSENPTFKHFLKQVRNMTLDAYAHQDLPFAKLVQELEPERDLSRNPLFQVAFQLFNLPRRMEASPDSDTPILAIRRGAAIFDLTFSAWENGNTLAAEIEYNSDLFDATTIQRIAANYETMLDGIIMDPDRHVIDLPLLSKHERRQLLNDWNATEAGYPYTACVHELVEAQVARSPNTIALVCDGEEVTYAGLNARANQLAHYLCGLGAGPDVLVGICVQRSPEMVVSLLAILKAGAGYVPLDPTHPAERLALILKDARLLLTEERLLSQLPKCEAQVVCVDRDRPCIARESTSNVGPVASPDNIAYVIYTSGSTGKPKGVEIPHRAVCNFLTSAQKEPGLSQEDVLAAVTTLSFDIASLEILLPLIVGARIALISTEVSRDGARLIRELANCRATVMQATPATWRMLLAAGWNGDNRFRVLCTGEELSRSLANQLLARSTSVWNLYGPTETTIWSGVSKVEPGEGSVPLGHPVANTRFYVVDSRLELVPIGVRGELCIAGTGLARGYGNRPELSAERFIADPYGLAAGARLYRTGDLVRYLSDGRVEFLGRSDHQVKLRGHRIELGEIESILGQHPAIREAAVALHENRADDRYLVGYIVPNPVPTAPAQPGERLASSNEQVARWCEIWDETYRQEPIEKDLTFNSGLKSSYTRLPIPAEEMREWVDHAVEKVRSFRPRKVLDIGCGPGLLMFRIAPECISYCGTDFSPTALHYVEEQLKELDLPQVSLFLRTAEDFSGFEPGSFDTVILNSVAQYFPDIEYLIRVLEGAVKVVQSGGRIFLGDIRSLPLLEAFHTSVELHSAPAALPLNKLRQRIDQRVSEEEELVVDPAFFFALQQHLTQISHVHVAPKRGRYRNELTRFRYDVELRVQAEVHRAANLTWRNWTSQQASLPAIRQFLSEAESKMLGVAYIPNARVTSEIKGLELLAHPNGLRTVGDLRDKTRDLQPDGLDPEEIWAWQEEAPFRIQLQWSGPGADHCFHAFISRRDTPEGMAEATAPSVPVETNSGKPWSAYANRPLEGMRAQELIPQLRRFLRTKLPDYMVPVTFVTLESLPLTPSGKLDRRALPAPERSRPRVERRYVLPRTRTEERVAAIWSDLLGIERTGAYDNFFELGGHSLLATRVLSRMREAFHVELPVRAFFETPTVAGLAQLVEEARARGEAGQTTTIVRLSREAHAATLLPGGVLDPADLSKGKRVKHKPPPARIET